MKNLMVIFGGIGLIVIVILFLLISPILMIWTINSLAEAGGSNFYIEHKVWNYFVALILIMLVRGGSGASSK